MIPIRLDKRESVLVSGGFSGDDIHALHSNPTLLSAKVSYIRNAVVNLYTKGYTTYVFTSNGLFELLVACVVNDFNGKGMHINSVFVNPYPGVSHGGMREPEEFSHMSICFSETPEEFDPAAFETYLSDSVDCVLSPSRIKRRDGYMLPDIFPSGVRAQGALN
ncbi:MAG: hypothetical protein LUD76_11490 [Alistipes sp.]|nr:hypothetical protein [Alistipes sp.]